MTSVEADKKVENGLLNDDVPDDSLKPPLLYSKRMFVVILLIITTSNTYAFRLNLSIAIVDMTSNKTITTGNQTLELPAEFNWDSKTIGIAMSIFFYGSLGLILGGNISTKFGGSTAFVFLTFVSGILAIVTPFLLNAHFYIFLAGRALSGLLEASLYVSFIDILIRWTPLQERSTLSAYLFSSSYIGSTFIYPYCGYVANNWGWRMVFYVTGFVNCTMALLQLIFVRNQPSEDKWISKKELNYLLRETDNTPRKDLKPPWKSILSSKCVWALFIAKFIFHWGSNILTICFPLYIKDMTKSTIDEIGRISIIPHIICIFVIPITGKFVDHCQNKNLIKMATIHKIIMIVGFSGASLLFMTVGFIADFKISMVCFATINIFLAFSLLSGQLVGISIAPKYAGTIAGVTGMAYGPGSILAPTFVGYMVIDHSQEEWRNCFIVSSIIIVIGTIIFLIYGSSEVQPWSNSANKVTKRDDYDLCDQNTHFSES